MKEHEVVSQTVRRIMLVLEQKTAKRLDLNFKTLSEMDNLAIENKS